MEDRNYQFEPFERLGNEAYWIVKDCIEKLKELKVKSTTVYKCKYCNFADWDADNDIEEELWGHIQMQLTNDSFFAGTVREWRDRKEGVAVIVSPHLFLSKGISTSKKPYLLMRVEETDVIIIRKHFFFTLDKRIFKNSDKDVTMIY